MLWHCSKRHGFTLVELLVVIAVIALLVSLMLPALGSARTSAKGVVCLSGLRSMGQAVVLYCDANKEFYPPSSHTTGSTQSGDAWLQSLQDYGVSPKFRLCLLDPARQTRLTSYATNEHFEALAPGIDYNPVSRKPIPGGRTRPFNRIGLVPRPCATIYIYEPSGTGDTDHLSTHEFKTAAHVKNAIAVTRHLNAGHFLFADGHARAWLWADLARTFSPLTSPFDPETAQ